MLLSNTEHEKHAKDDKKIGYHLHKNVKPAIAHIAKGYMCLQKNTKYTGMTWIHTGQWLPWWEEGREMNVGE